MTKLASAEATERLRRPGGTDRPAARARVLREVTREEAARTLARFRRMLAGPPHEVDAATLRDAEADSV